MMTIIILILIIIKSRLTSLFILFFLIKSLSRSLHSIMCAAENITVLDARRRSRRHVSLFCPAHIYKMRLQQPPLNVIIISLTHIFTYERKNSWIFYFHINIFALSELIRKPHIRWLPFLFTLTRLNLRNST